MLTPPPGLPPTAEPDNPDSAAVPLDLADLPVRQECAVVVQTGVRIGGTLYETSK